MAVASRTMAKAKRSGRPAEPARVTLLGLKGTPAFGLWLERLCDHTRLPLPTLLEHALIEYARAHGFGEDPPKR